MICFVGLTFQKSKTFSLTQNQVEGGAIKSETWNQIISCNLVFSLVARPSVGKYNFRHYIRYSAETYLIVRLDSMVLSHLDIKKLFMPTLWWVKGAKRGRVRFRNGSLIWQHASCNPCKLLFVYECIWH